MLLGLRARTSTTTMRSRYSRVSPVNMASVILGDTFDAHAERPASGIAGRSAHTHTVFQQFPPVLVPLSLVLMLRGLIRRSVVLVVVGRLAIGRMVRRLMVDVCITMFKVGGLV